MKNLMHFFLLSVFLIGLAGCGGSKSPADIETSIYKEFKSGNYEKGVEIFLDNAMNVNKEDKAKVEETIKAFSGKAKEGFEKKGGLKSFKIASEEISEDGQSATVITQIEYGNGETDEEKSQYQLVDGNWKIVTGK